jgi:hypothetical protein
MKKSFSYFILSGALLAAAPFTAVSQEGEKVARLDAVAVTITASVQSIDQKSREVTLKGPLGNTVTLTVDKRVKRLDEMKVGDLVTAEYFISVAADLREPTAEEKEHPLTALKAAAKAPPGTSPAAGGLRCFKVVATVEGLDRPTQTITVKGPRGNYLTTRVEDPANLTKMRIGDQIVLTYAEALAISLEKTSKKHAD